MTVDADAFFFLHDLITSYVKEKEKMVSIWKLFCESFEYIFVILFSVELSIGTCVLTKSISGS